MRLTLTTTKNSRLLCNCDANRTKCTMNYVLAERVKIRREAIIGDTSLVTDDPYIEVKHP